MSKQVIYQFYAELSDYKYGCNRRFQIKANESFAKLGYVLMTLFEMKASHLFRFNYDIESNFIRNTNEYINNDVNQRVLKRFKEEPFLKFCLIEVPNKFTPPSQLYQNMDATVMTIKDVMLEVNEFIDFEYDFGDSWNVHLILEEIIITDTTYHPSKNYPKVISGKGFGIVEDCGGTGGLESIYRAFERKSGKKYEEYVDWLASDQLDLISFNIEEMNSRIKKVPKIFKKIYEINHQITDAEYKYLQRETFNKDILT